MKKLNNSTINRLQEVLEACKNREKFITLIVPKAKDIGVLNIFGMVGKRLGEDKKGGKYLFNSKELMRRIERYMLEFNC